MRIILSLQAAVQRPNDLIWNVVKKSASKTGLKITTRVIGEQKEFGNWETLAWLAKVKMNGIATPRVTEGRPKEGKQLHELQWELQNFPGVNAPHHHYSNQTLEQSPEGAA